MVLRGWANILGTYAVTDCRCSHEDTVFLTTISFVGVLASSNGVSEISAFGTNTSATVKRRKTTASRVGLAWPRNIAEERLRRENETGGEAALIVCFSC
jgi:hypothetical protein